MDRAQEALERARHSEQTLASLRQELASLEASTRGPSLGAALDAQHFEAALLIACELVARARGTSVLAEWEGCRYAPPPSLCAVPLAEPARASTAAVVA